MNKILRAAHQVCVCHRSYVLRMQHRLRAMQGDTRMHQPFSTASEQSSLKINTNTNKGKKDSHWIYSTKHEEQLYRKEGKISIYCNVGRDVHNASMRLTQNIEQAQIIITSEPAAIHRFLSSLANKQQFTPTEASTPSVSTELVQKHADSEITISMEDYLKETKTLQFDTEIEISKMIELEKQTNKERGESVNAKLLEQSKELKQYMNVKVMQKILLDVKSRQGYPFVMELTHQLETASSKEESVYSQMLADRKIDMENLLQLKKNGFNLLFLFPEEGSQSHIIQQLEHKQIPYEILPCTNVLITAIVSSGLPADRFSIEVHPTENLEGLLARRAKMKITMCFQIETTRLQELVAATSKIYGSEHVVYLHGDTEGYYRGEVSYLQEHLSTHPIKQKNAYLILAPLITEFNQSLNKEINMEKHILNELQADSINAVEMEILMKKLQKYNKKEEVYNIDVYLMVAEMLARIQDDQQVKSCLMRMFKFRSEEWVEGALRESKKFVVVDHLGWGESGRKQKGSHQKNSEIKLD